MPKKKQRHLPLEVEKWLHGTLTMTALHRGIYINLLCLEFQNGPLTEVEALAACGLGATHEQVREVLAMKFHFTEGRWVHLRLERDRERSARRSEAGRKGAETRWQSMANSMAKYGKRDGKKTPRKTRRKMAKHGKRDGKTNSKVWQKGWQKKWQSMANERLDGENLDEASRACADLVSRSSLDPKEELKPKNSPLINPPPFPDPVGLEPATESEPSEPEQPGWFGPSATYEAPANGHAFPEAVEGAPASDSSDERANGQSNKKTRQKGSQRPLTSNDVFLRFSEIPELVPVINDWLAYKSERRETYKPTGLKQFFARLEKRIEELGSKEVIQRMQRAMASNWAGWDFESAVETGKAKPALVQKIETFQERNARLQRELILKLSFEEAGYTAEEAERLSKLPPDVLKKQKARNQSLISFEGESV